MPKTIFDKRLALGVTAASLFAAALLVTIFAEAAPDRFASTSCAAFAATLVVLVPMLVALRSPLAKAAARLGLRRVRIWAVAAAMLGALAVISIPLRSSFRPSRPHQLRVTALPRPGAAQPARAWVHGLYTSDGDRLVGPLAFKRQGAWTFEYDVVAFPGADPAANALIWSGSLRQRPTLKLLDHPNAGLLEVCWDGEAAVLDLRAPNPRIRLHALAHEQGAPVLPWWLLRLAQVLATGGAIFLAGVLLAGRAPSVSGPQENGRHATPARLLCARTFLLVTILLTLCWGLALVALWPGIVNEDALVQWNEVLTGRYTNWHPASHTLLVAALTKPWRTPAMLVALHILALALLVGACVGFARARGASLVLVGVVVAAVLASPSILAYQLTAGKDGLYGISMLLLTAGIALAVWRRAAAEARRPDDRRLGRVAWGFCVLGALGVALTRHNGDAVALGTLGALVVIARGHRRAATLALSVAVLGVVVVRGPLYGAFDVRRLDLSMMKYCVLLQHIAAHQHAGTPMTGDQRRLVAGWHDLPREMLPYSPWRIPAYIFHEPFHSDRFQAQTAEALALWADLTMRAPEVIVRHQIRATEHIWRLKPQAEGWFVAHCWYLPSGEFMTINGNDFGLKQAHVWPMLETPLARWLNVTRSPPPILAVLFMRSAFALWTLGLGVVVAVLRSGRWCWVVIALPLLCNDASLAVFAVNQDLRFHFGALLVGAVVAPLLMSRAIPLAAAPDRERLVIS